ncbi:MAG: acyltransferase [Myxococcales bacterium]|nr:acyltransferase [Myxococcales bacterium]
MDHLQRSRKPPTSHGDGSFTSQSFLKLGTGVIFEAGVLVFHPETIRIGDDVYVGHQAILKGYFRGEMHIGSGTWIGQQCFLHSAGSIFVGTDVGIGPGVKMLTSTHQDPGIHLPIMEGELKFAPIVIGEGSDIGTSAVLLPGTVLGRGCIVGAGAVTKGTFPDYAVIAGVPAKVLKIRDR